MSDFEAARIRRELLMEARRNAETVPVSPGVERIGEPADISLGEGIDGEVRYFTLEDSGLLIRSRWEHGGHWLEYVERTTGAWVDDPTLIDLFVGDDPFGGPDLDLTGISEPQASELALRYGARL
jgi:hypothetical protein